MRITSLLAGLAAGLTLAVSGCGVAPEPEQLPPQEQPAEGEVTAQAVCPYLWTCDSVRFYSTQAQCTAACGSDCYRDYACRVGCLCP